MSEPRTIIGELNNRDINRFFQKINKNSPNGCWIWTGSMIDDNYGQFWFNNGNHLAHRISWIIHNGKIPDGKLVCHNCPNGDNPLCVNPDHLWLGSQTENNRDKILKGTQQRGEQIGISKLTADDILMIRQIYEIKDKFKITQHDLAKAYNVSQFAIHQIITRKTWKHV